MPKITVHNFNLYYEEWGSGDPVLLIMGLGANTTDWGILPSTLSRKYRVIAFDNRDSGRSDDTNGAISISSYADDAANFLTTMKIDRAHIIGVSMGGMISQELAINYPHLLSTLTLGATMCGGEHAVNPPINRIMEWVNNGKLPPNEAAEKNLPFLYSSKFIKQNRDSLIESSIAGARLRPPQKNILRQLSAIAHFDSYSRLSQINVPTLVISGNSDSIVPGENSHILANNIKGSRLELIEGVGHGFLQEASEKVSSIILSFLNNHHR